MPKKDSLDVLSIKAHQIMSSPLITLRAGDTVRHAAGVLLDKNISGVPVLNHLGQPVGALTKTDIVRYEREHAAMTESLETRQSMRTLGTLEIIAAGRGFHRETEEDYVSHWMTPKIFTVDKDASLAEVLREMVEHRVHRLFVKDAQNQRLAGVITTFDLMKFLARVFMVNAANPKVNTTYANL